MPPAFDYSNPMGAARGLAQAIRDAAPEAEAATALPTDLVARMRAGGLFHLVLPRELGGAECDPIEAARVVEEVSAADGSAGWCVMIAAQNQGFAGFLEADAIEEIWGEGRIVCGTARPIGRAVPVSSPEVGYRVSGRWPFASGSSHADWFGGECVIYDGDVPRRNADGSPQSAIMPVRREFVTVHPTWDTTGLRASASNDFSIADVFVPARHAIAFFEPPKQAWPAYRALPLLMMNHGSQALGVARAAIEVGVEVARTKLGWGDVPLYDVPRVQVAIAEATVARESAAAYLYATSQALWDAVNTDTPDEALVRLRARTRLAAAHAATASARAVDLIHGVAGTSAIFRKSPLERQFRDIHTALAHVMVGPLVYGAAGRVELGRDPEFPFF